MSALQEIAMDLEARRAGQEAATEEVRPAAPTPDATGLSARFDRLSIGSKFRLIFAINLGFALVLGLSVILATVHLGDRADRIAAEHDHAMNAQNLVSIASEAQRHSEALVASGDGARAQAALAQLSLADEQIAELRAKVQGNDLAATDTLALISAGVEDFRRQIRNYDIAAQNANRREALAIEVQATGALVQEATQDIANDLEYQAEAMADEGADFIGSLTLAWIAASFALLGLTLMAMRYFDRHVGGTLTSMTAEMGKLAAGDRNVNITGLSRQDEIGDMARAMSVFHRGAMRLERLSRERAEKARAELDEKTRLQIQQEEAQLERERMLSEVADQFERSIGDVVSTVAEASAQLQSTSREMASTADRSSARVSEVGTSMAEANSGATAAAAASDEFAMSIGEISRQAASSAELARKATDSAAEADTTISTLSASAQQVGQIVELIQTIAQRTNLLALNASIEAARGGEAGRGFAVVASEVKELAMQTSRATEQVGEQIRAMQDSTGASVGALRSIAKQVQELESTAVSIASAVDQQSVAGQDLAHSIDLAARGTEQMTGHIEEVRQLSLSTGSAASQVLSSSTNLEEQASVLRAQAAAFLAKVRAN